MYTITKIDNSLTASFYQQFTFPLFRSYLDNCQPSGFTVAIAVNFLKKPIGLAMAIVLPDLKAEILSIFVSVSHRGKGIGTALFSRLLEELTKKGCQSVELTYITGKPTTPALERLLEKFGWDTPQPQMLLCKWNCQISQVPWLQINYRLSPEFAIFPWLEMTKEERIELQEQKVTKSWIPPQLDPFQHEKNLEPLNSLGLRYQTVVVGWIITHRLSPDTIRYTCSYIRPDLQKVGKILALYAESIQRQAANPEISQAIWTVPFVYSTMVNFVKRRMQPYLSSIEETRHSSLTIKSERYSEILQKIYPCEGFSTEGL